MNPSTFIPLSERSGISPEESSDLQQKGRKGSSSESYDGPVWAVEKIRFGFSEPLRIAFPQPLPKLPIEIMPIAGEETRLAIFTACQRETLAIMNRESLAYTEIGIFLVKGAREVQPSPTLLISTEGDLDLTKAKSVLVHIARMLHQKDVKDLRVEIAAPHAHEVERVHHINDDHPLVKLWPRKVKSKVLDLLEYIPFSELGVYRYGYSLQTAVPTVTITVKDETFDVREELKEAIIKVCASNGAPGMRVAVLFDEVNIKASAHKEPGAARLQHYTMRPGLGHSIGVASRGEGTLGGYIALVDRKSNVRRPVFLTCWHVLRPGDGANLLPIYDKGTRPYGEWPQVSPDHAHVSSVALSDLNKRITQLTDLINGLNPTIAKLAGRKQAGTISDTDLQELDDLNNDRTDYQTTLQSYLNHRQRKDEVFGYGKIASGFRTIEGVNDPTLGRPRHHALDWAVGEPLPERLGSNNLPTEEALDDLSPDDFPLRGKTTVSAFNTSMEYEKKNFFKVGRSTGLTVGHYNCITAVVNITLPDGSDRQTDEFTIVGLASKNGIFHRGGDSGAWIMDFRGACVGMLWGGDKACTRCYFTPIGWVLADIEAKTGMKVEML